MKDVERERESEDEQDWEEEFQSGQSINQCKRKSRSKRAKRALVRFRRYGSDEWKGGQLCCKGANGKFIKGILGWGRAIID